MKLTTAIFVCLMLAPVASALAQIQVGPQYRGIFVEGVSVHTGGVAFEAHFPQGNWAWGAEFEATTGPDLRYWTTAMFNAGLLIDDLYIYGRAGAGRVVGESGASASGGLFGVGVNLPFGKALRADFAVDTDSYFDGIASSASLRYQFPSSSERIREPYDSTTSKSRNYRNSGSKGRFYFGGGIGRSDIDAEGFDDPMGFNIRGGWIYNPYLALEASYFKPGKSDDDYGEYTWYIDGDALQFGIRYGTDIRQPWQFYTRLGYALWDFELDALSTGQGKVREEGSDIYYGAGVAYSRDESRYFLELQRMMLDTEGDNTDVDTVSVGFEYRCCSRSVDGNSYVSKPQTPEASVPNRTSYESTSAQTMQASANSAVIVEILDQVESDEVSSAIEVVAYSPEEEVVVTAPAPVHPMKIAIQEGCNVVSVKVIGESEVWDLFCPSTLKRITVTI